MTTALKMALCVDRAYKHKEENKNNKTNRVVSDDSFIEYIESIIAHPKKNFLKEFALQPRLRIDTESGVDAYLEIVEGNLRIGIAGTNSALDWFWNVVHLKDSLAVSWKWTKDDRAYEIGHETLFGHISKYLLFYDDLIKKEIAPPITSISVAGHSAGGRIADRIAWELGYGYSRYNCMRKILPVDLYTFASPLFEEFYSEKRLADANIRSLERYAIEGDIVSNFPVWFLDRLEVERRSQYLTVFPKVSTWNAIANHSLDNFIEMLSDLSESIN